MTSERTPPRRFMPSKGIVMHLPVNHPLSRLYRVLAGLAGAFLVLFGALSLGAASDDGAFARSDTTVLGLHTNLAMAILSLVFGIAIVVSTIIGGNIHHLAAMWIGTAMAFLGLLMLLVQRTDANIVNATVGTCVLWMLLGMLLVTDGLYGKTGSQRQAAAEDRIRHRPTGAVPTDGDVALARVDPTE